MENTNLSEREIEIIKLVGQGKSNKEIAQALVISVNTVKVHLNNVFKKIGVSSRTEATIYAIEHKLIDSPLPEPEPVQVFVPINVIEEPEQSKFSKFLNRFWWVALLVGIALLVGLGFLFSSSNLFSEPVPTANPLLNTINQDRWRVFPSIPTARTSMAITHWDNEIYTVAGLSEEGTTAVMERFSVSNNTWESLASKLTPVELAGAAVIGGKIYVPGGQLSDGSLTDILEVYDIRTDAWSKKSPLPYALADYGMSTYEGSLYVFGGWDGEGFQDGVLHYNPAMDKWEEMSAMPTGRSGVSVVTIGERMFVIGGKTEDGDCLSIDVYYPNQDIAGGEPWQSQLPLDSEVQFLGAQEVAGSLFLFSLNENQDFQLNYYTPLNNSWYSYIEEAQMLPDEQAQLSSVNGEVYFLGGTDSTGLPSGKVIRYKAVFTIVLPQIVN